MYSQELTARLLQIVDRRSPRARAIANVGIIPVCVSAYSAEQGKRATINPVATKKALIEKVEIAVKDTLRTL
jgi:hypothetical protein